jgi:hypothetical protein
VSHAPAGKVTAGGVSVRAARIGVHCRISVK